MFGKAWKVRLISSLGQIKKYDCFLLPDRPSFKPKSNILYLLKEKISLDSPELNSGFSSKPITQGEYKEVDIKHLIYRNMMHYNSEWKKKINKKAVWYVSGNKHTFYLALHITFGCPKWEEQVLVCLCIFITICFYLYDHWWFSNWYLTVFI